MALPGEEPTTPPVPASWDNDAFFGDLRGRRSLATVPPSVFFRRPPPPAEPGAATWAAMTPARFGLVLLVGGWVGILFQRNFLQQLVVGAPLFEEPAKLGPAVLLAALLGLRSPYLRMPLALLSGAAFGVFEHVSTYPDENAWLYGGRVVFHAAATGVSMAFFTAFERLPDVRGRWASTVVATLLHWANNFGALLLGVLSLFLPVPEAVAYGHAGLVTLVLALLALAAWIAPGPFSRRSRDALRRLLPWLFEEKADPSPRPPAEKAEPASFPPP